MRHSDFDNEMNKSTYHHRIKARLNNFRVPIDSSVRLTFARRVPEAMDDEIQMQRQQLDSSFTSEKQDQQPNDMNIQTSGYQSPDESRKQQAHRESDVNETLIVSGSGSSLVSDDNSSTKNELQSSTQLELACLLLSHNNNNNHIIRSGRMRNTI